ncbi:ER membrane protein complex subunit 1 [Aphelenchoides besseyi]|nr:ER membrane protein complex subunit 1 [Aphelenchoides besseyi]
MSSRYVQLAQKILARYGADSNFNGITKVCRLVEAEKDRVTVEFEVDKSMTNSWNTLHGGCTASLVDMITTTAILTNDRNEQQHPGVSVDLKVRRVQSLGCPKDLLFGSAKTGDDYLLLSTDKNLVAAVGTNSGEILWRQLNEDTRTITESPSILLNGNDLLVIVNGGEYLRMFDRVTGTLKWQTRLAAKGIKPSDIVHKNSFLVVLLKDKLIALTKNGDRSWSTTLSSEVEWSGILSAGKHIIAIGRSKDSHLRLHAVLYSDGLEVKRTVDSFVLEKFVVKNCAFAGSSLACFNDRTVHTVYFNDETTKITNFDVPGSESVVDVRALQRSNLFVVKHGAQNSFLRVDENDSVVLVTTNSGAAAAGSRSLLAVYVDAMKKIRVFDQKSGKQVSELDVKFDIDSPVREIQLLESDNDSTFQMVLLRADCRVDYLEANRNDKSVGLEWSRFEGLASISSVEMIDLPLSESQATIETEFSAQDEARPQKRPRGGASADEAKVQLPMERDYFNLRKLIIVSTHSGSLYAIHNQYGLVVWSLYLGTQFEPLKSQLGVSTVPLFIQRTTANYQFDSQAAVGTSKTRILFFNPIDGKVVNSHTVDSVKRVDMAPFPNAEMLHPLIIVDSKDKVQFLPPLPSNFQLPQPLHLFSVDLINGILSGFIVQQKQLDINPTWTTKLNLGADEKIALVVGKRRNERVHSQGKVLGDREVLYKYSNPNLVAVLTVDQTHTTIVINLIDAVSGSIVYTAKHERASNPVHLLHCENWVVYSYWNEKARRTEIGIIELYEGLEQTNAKHFNSFTTVRHPLNVIASSFVFPQGISAVGASDTEQGLTTRSVIVAMPFGGILEISKRMLDARRPMEMTAELREEMVLPYMPEIPIASEDLINYNQTAMQINGIRTAPSGLESTSLMLAYGLDLFYTRLTPSGTFDVLKDDFDYVLISLVLLALVIASFVFKRIARYQNLKQAWA